MRCTDKGAQKADCHLMSGFRRRNQSLDSRKKSHSTIQAKLSRSYLSFGASASIVVCSSLALVLWIVQIAGTNAMTSEAHPKPVSSKPFTLMVTLEFKTLEHKETFLNDYFPPVAKHVRIHEPTTLAYEALLSDKDPLRVLMLERYEDKDVAYLQVHKSSQPFLDFRPKLKAMQDEGFVTISGQSYLDSGVGFADRMTSSAS